MMSQQAVTRLLALAHDRSEQGRGALVTELATLFDQAEISLSQREQTLVNEIVDGLISGAQVSLRQLLADKLAPSATAPRKLLMTLANDRIEVARPILTQSVVLTDSDLVTLVVTQGVEHARAVALRAEIGEALVDALVVTGDLTVMQSIAENMGAKISPKAMNALAGAARFAEQLCQPVLGRPELNPETAAKLYWWVAPELRRFAIKRFGVAVGQADQALEQTVDDLLSRYEMEKNEDQIMAQVADWLVVRDLNTAKTLVQVLRLGHFRLFNILLGRLINLGLDLVDMIVVETGGRSLAVACRAIGVEKPQFVSLFLLSQGGRGGAQIVHPRELNQALSAFDRLTPPVARQLLDNWRRDPSYLLNRALGKGADERH
ncbi:MAG: DUF2336 domain-containing protein [Alphaproteobacteria bacterium]